MYIEPNSNIKIYHNVPLDNTYKNTLYFSSLASQNAYFHTNQNIIKFNLTAQSYQRVVKGSMRIAVKADNLYDCNYLSFQNASFGTKWFYAFITGVEYVNNETSEITFEIDVMQTYLFDITLKSCFIERQHSVTDKAGDNLVEENLAIGEYQLDLDISSGVFGNVKINNDGSFDGFRPYVMYTAPDRLGAVKGEMIANVYCGTTVSSFSKIYNENPGTGDGINNWLSDMNAENRLDEIVCIYMAPKNFDKTEHGDIQTRNFGIAKPSGNGRYTPRNKKLLCYPYRFMLGNNNQGNTIEYHYEDFSTDDCIFSVSGGCLPDSQYLLYPHDYRGLDENYVDVLSLTGLPQCSFSGDYFKAWLAQNNTQIGLSLLSSANSAVASVALAGMTGGASVAGSMAVESAKLSAGTNSLNGVLGLIGSVAHAKAQPDSAKGNQTSNIMYALNRFDFTFNHVYIRPEFCKIIDDFFDMYGYATRRVGVPNRSSRPHWNYVKTRGCNAIGNCPTDDLHKVCNIYDNGITFWKSASEVGNYSLNNSPS
jgi:hypothetical protein